MKKLLNNILCFFGLHMWEITYDDGPKIEKECSHCEKQKSTMYDMCYGGTYWVNGKKWSI